MNSILVNILQFYRDANVVEVVVCEVMIQDSNSLLPRDTNKV